MNFKLRYFFSVFVAMILLSGCSLPFGNKTPAPQNLSETVVDPNANQNTNIVNNNQNKNETPDTTNGSHYVNNELGFSLDLPVYWGDRYSINSNDSSFLTITGVNPTTKEKEYIVIVNSLEQLSGGPFVKSSLKPIVTIKNKSIYILPVSEGGLINNDLYKTLMSFKVLDYSETQNLELQKNVNSYIASIKEIYQKSSEQTPSKARDAKRMADVRMIQSGVEVYFGNNGKYPNSLSDLKDFFGGTSGLQNPLPGGIPYQYIKNSDGKGYRVLFSLENDVSQFKAGLISCSANQKVDLCNFDKVVPQDKDGDDVLDDYEVNVYKTDPNKFDTDGDGFADGVEIKNGYDPLKK